MSLSICLRTKSRGTGGADHDWRDRSIDTSVRSSVYDFVEENGRRYHRYKEGCKFASMMPKVVGDFAWDFSC